MANENELLKLYTLKGLPGSGKSFYCNELMTKEPNQWKHVNKDALRSMIDNSVYTHENENLVDAVQYYITRKALQQGKNVLFDNCNLSANIFKRICEVAQEVGGVVVEEKIFDVPVDVCIERDAKREGIKCVGEKVIRDMYKRFSLEKGFPEAKRVVYEKLECNDSPSIILPEDTTLKPACIIDVDGTVAIVTDRSPYDASHCYKDKPITQTIDIVKMCSENGYKIFFLTGREEKYRDATVSWLGKHVGINDYELLMRPNGDTTKDNIYKKEMYLQKIKPFYNTKFVTDDRPRICRMFRDECGLVVLQMGHKEF